MHTQIFTVVQDRPYGAGVVALRPLAEGAVVADLTECVEVAEPTIHTIDVGGDRHIDGPQVRYLNHSCAPNTYVDTTRMEVRTLRPVHEGEELTFFYPSTEWEMVGPFTCLCGAPMCLGVVAGARSMPEDVLRRHVLNDHVRARLDGPAGMRGGATSAAAR